MSNFLDSSFTSLNNLTDINTDSITVNSLTISDNINGITTTQLSYIDPTSSIQTQIDYLKTQTLSTNGGGSFMIYAELNGSLNSSNSSCFQWSFGAGGHYIFNSTARIIYRNFFFKIVGRIVSTFTTNGVVGAQVLTGNTPNISIGTISISGKSLYFVSGSNTGTYNGLTQNSDYGGFYGSDGTNGFLIAPYRITAPTSQGTRWDST
eukprot:gene14886-20019_t